MRIDNLGNKLCKHGVSLEHHCNGCSDEKYPEKGIELNPILFTPEALLYADNEASKAASKAAKSQAEYENADELSEDIMAAIKSQLSPNEKTSETKLERLARCNNRWTEHAAGVREARLRAAIDRADAKNKERSWQTIQSALSYIKEGMKRNVV